MVKFLEDDERMASMVWAYKASISSTQYKFGVEIPWNMKHALELNKVNGNAQRIDAIAAELKGINQYQTFCCLETGEMLSPDYSPIP